MIYLGQIKKAFLTVIILVLLTGWSQAQKYSRLDYINQYKKMAQDEMKRTGIPASITLAQGMLESGTGNSTLARKGNNHFGIKCHNWKGKSMRHDDDRRNECFRKYKSAYESYVDHSDFLVNGRRYSFLFEYDNDDYKSWAKGLKKAGYATSPTYAKALIKLIEENQLYVYDQQVIAELKGKKPPKLASKTHDKENLSSGESIKNFSVKYKNRVKYIVAGKKQNIEELSLKLDMFAWQLPKYNEMDASDEVTKGQIVYLQPKRNRADVKHKTHMVKEGESLHDISQQYAVKLHKLAKKNRMEPDAELNPGQEISLRKRVKKGDNDLELNIKSTKATEEETDFEIDFDLGG